MFTYRHRFFFKKKKKSFPPLHNNNILTALERQQLQHRINFFSDEPVYFYYDKDLTEVTATTLMPWRVLNTAILIVENCDVDLGTVQVWVHAGIKNIFLIGCNVISQRWRSALPILADSVAEQPIQNYPFLQFQNCQIQDNITFTILADCTFNHFVTDIGTCFSVNFEPEPRPNSRCYADALFDGCVLGKDGILKTEDDHYIPIRSTI